MRGWATLLALVLARLGRYVGTSQFGVGNGPSQRIAETQAILGGGASQTRSPVRSKNLTLSRKAHFGTWAGMRNRAS